MSKKYIFCIVIFTLFLDQISKRIVVENIEIFANNLEISKYFNLVYVENRGVSFGMFSEHDKSFYFGILSMLVSAYIIYLLIKSKDLIESLGLSLILGGAIGNGVDRLYYGYVIDFIDFHLNNIHWPAFNFADSFITIGAVVFISSLFSNKVE
ncbi:MAG: signal peptidase II [Alphaproteobacteria bacterium]